MLVLLLSLGFVSPVVACPWDTVQSAYATRSLVVVNDVTYPVQGTLNRVAFQSVLLSCGEQDAAVMFDLWTRHKQIANVTGVGGLFLAPQLWIGTGIFAVLSAGDKALLIESLVNDAPVAPRRELQASQPNAPTPAG